MSLQSSSITPTSPCMALARKDPVGHRSREGGVPNWDRAAGADFCQIASGQPWIVVREAESVKSSCAEEGCLARVIMGQSTRAIHFGHCLNCGSGAMCTVPPALSGSSPHQGLFHWSQLVEYPEGLFGYSGLSEKAALMLARCCHEIGK